MRAALIAVLLTLACSGSKAPAPAAPATPSGAVAPHRVVMISIDGLRPEYWRTPDAYGAKIPTLRKLVAEGATATMKSVWPTVTYPAHTTLVTGVRPARHGIVNNLPFDPLGQNFDGWYWYASEIRTPTLWQRAKERGYTTANVYWPVTVGASFDWSFPQIWRAKVDEDDKLMRALTTPGLFDEVRAKYGRTPAEHRGDDARGDAAEWVLGKKQPDLSFFYFTDLDTVQHGTGPFSKQAVSTLETIDAQLARLVAVADAKTTFVVVSDHGFAPIDKLVRPTVLLRAAGLLEVEGGRVKSYRAAAWKAGGTCAIMLRDPKDAATKQAVATLFREAAANPASGIAHVWDGAEIEAKGGFPGAALVLEAAPGFMFSASVEGPAVGPSGERGSHGYSPESSEMNASLVLSGSGIRKGAALGQVDMTDVAPTVAKLLALDLPNVDGKPLDAALTP